MDWVDKPQYDKDLYGILQLSRGSYLNNFSLKTLTLGWVAFHSLTLVRITGNEFLLGVRFFFFKARKRFIALPSVLFFC